MRATSRFWSCSQCRQIRHCIFLGAAPKVSENHRRPFSRRIAMRQCINGRMLAIAVIIGTAYGAFLSYQQWNWYLGSPDGTWAQGLAEFGWPTTHVSRTGSITSPEVHWNWSMRNLCINCSFCLVLSVSVAHVAYRIGNAMWMSNARTISLATLFNVTTSVAAIFPLWKLVLCLPSLGIDRWGIVAFEIPRSLLYSVVLGLFLLAYGVVAGVTSFIPAMIPRLNGRHRSLQVPS